MELAYRLAVSEQPMIQQIRRNLVVLINPVSEPDGHEKMVDWFYRASTDFPSLGTPVASDDITGGMGWVGLSNLQRFVNEGGLMITLGNATMLALEGGLVRNVRRAADQGVQTHGVELKVRFTSPGHPRPALRQRESHRFQFQPHAPGPESLGLPAPLERHPELEKNPVRRTSVLIISGKLR